MIRFYAAAIAAALAGCAAAPTLDTQPEAFTLILSGDVAAKDYQVALDCIMDRLDAATPMLSGGSFRQQRRANGYRIDRMAGSIVGFTIDVSTTGHVEFRESTSSALVSTVRYQEAVKSCIERFKP
jgi:hypothetical protein